MSEKDNISFSQLFLSWSLERSNFFIAAHSYKEDNWLGTKVKASCERDFVGF